MPLALAPRLAATLALALSATLGFGGTGRAEIAGAYLAARSADMAADFAPAREYLTRALVEDPGNIGLMEALLLANVGLGDFQMAMPVARRLAMTGNQIQIARLVLLVEMLGREDYAQVLTDLQGGAIAGPLIDPLVRGWAQLGAGSMAQALEEFDKVAQTRGLGVFGLYHKGLALALAGDFEGAERLFADPENGLATTRRAVVTHAQILSQLDRAPDALALLDRSFGSVSDPELDALRAALEQGGPIPFTAVRNVRDGMAETFFLLAVVLQGEAPDAQVLINSRMAEYLRPDHIDAMLMSAVVLESLGRDELAVAAYERVPPSDPVYLAAATSRIEALYRLGRKEDALAAMAALVESHGQYISTHVAQGDMLRREERYAEAAAAYARAIAQLPAVETRHWGLFYSLAVAYEQAKDWDKAEPEFRRALELNPEQPEVLNYLGYSLLDRNIKIDEALDMIERAVRQRPRDGYIIDSLAWGFFLTGRYPEALEQMERASLLMPVDPVVTDHLGDVYWAVGRLNEARFQWRRALSFDPTERDANLIRRKLEVGLDAVLAEEGLTALKDRGRQ